MLYNYLIPEIISSIVGLIISGVWAYFVITHKKYNRSKQRTRLREYQGNISAYFRDLEIHTDEKIELIDYQIDKFRQDLKKIVIREKISEEMFNQASHFLNQKIHFTRIAYIKYLFKPYKFMHSSLGQMFSDKELTREEIFRILEKITTTHELEQNQKTFLKEKIVKHCITNDKVKSPDDLLNFLNMDRDLFLKENIRRFWRTIPFIVISIILLIMFLFLRNHDFDKPKQEKIVIGFLEYKDHKHHVKFKHLLEKHLNLDNSDPFIEIKLYRHSEKDKLLRDAERGKVQGFVLNPGTLIKYLEQSPNIVKEFEIFAQHRSKGLEIYHPVLIAHKSTFQKFCIGNGYDSSFVDQRLPILMQSQESKFSNLIRDYIISADKISLSKESSLSGYMMPLKFIQSRFGISESFLKTKAVSHEGHDKLRGDVFEGEIILGSTYQEGISAGESDSLIAIYNLPIVPYNSYWISKQLDKSIRDNIKQRFLRMNPYFDINTSELKITGWIEMSTENYINKMKPIFELVNPTQRKIPLEIKIPKEFPASNSVAMRISNQLKTIGIKWIDYKGGKFDEKYIAVLGVFDKSNSSQDTSKFLSYNLTIDLGAMKTRKYLLSNQFYNRSTHKVQSQPKINFHCDGYDIKTNPIAISIANFLCPRGRIQKSLDGFQIQLSTPINVNSLSEFKMICVSKDNKFEFIRANDYIVNESGKSIIPLSSNSKFANKKYLGNDYVVMLIKNY
jgi:ABC-type phosphate/phosphonate transport system substrate-binding protein